MATRRPQCRAIFGMPTEAECRIHITPLMPMLFLCSSTHPPHTAPMHTLHVCPHFPHFLTLSLPATFPHQANEDPGLYMRCAEFFMQHRQFDKATKMLIAAHQYTRALEMCIEHEVVITEVGDQGKGRHHEGVAMWLHADVHRA